MQACEPPPQQPQVAGAASRAMRGNLVRMETRANTNVSLEESQAM